MEKFDNQNLFVVWWIVRDILLGKKKDIIDIDLTTAGNPDDIWSRIQNKATSDISIFRTEKFGTMSIVRDTIKYEITPFREESWYSDMRHPDQIVWSNDLVKDAGRRDFTINALYYSWVNHAMYWWSLSWGGIDSTYTDGYDIDSNMLKSWWLVVWTVLIIQDHDMISKLLPDGKFDYQSFVDLGNKIWYNSKAISWIIRDPYWWIQSLIDETIKCVGIPDHRFLEDPLRILRAIRFQNTLNFDPDLWVQFDYEKWTRLGMKKYYYLVKTLSKERLHDEVKKVFSWPNPFGYIAVLDELNLIKSLFPNITFLKHLDQPIRYHPFDVYTHSLLALHHLQSINTSYLVRLGMLYHDVGKSEQYYTHSFWLSNDDRSFIYGWRLNHVNCGQDMVRKDLELIGFSNKEIDEVVRYVAKHMKPGEILMSKPDNWTKKLRELYAEWWYEWTRNLLDICKWDRRGHFNPIQRSSMKDVDQLYVLLDNLRDSEGQFTMSKLAINGQDIMQEFHLEPGKNIGELLKKAYERVMEDVVDRNDKTKIITWLHT